MKRGDAVVWRSPEGVLLYGLVWEEVEADGQKYVMLYGSRGNVDVTTPDTIERDMTLPEVRDWAGSSKTRAEMLRGWSRAA